MFASKNNNNEEKEMKVLHLRPKTFYSDEKTCLDRCRRITLPEELLAQVQSFTGPTPTISKLFQKPLLPFLFALFAKVFVPVTSLSFLEIQ